MTLSLGILLEKQGPGEARKHGILPPLEPSESQRVRPIFWSVGFRVCVVGFGVYVLGLFAKRKLLDVVIIDWGPYKQLLRGLEAGNTSGSTHTKRP